MEAERVGEADGTEIQQWDSSGSQRNFHLKNKILIFDKILKSAESKIVQLYYRYERCSYR